MNLQNGRIAFSFKNCLQIVQISRPNSIEFQYKAAENSSITSIAFNGKNLAVSCENSGIIFLDESNNEISAFPAPVNDSFVNVCVSQISQEFVVSTRRGEVLVFRTNGVLKTILSENTGENIGGLSGIAVSPQGGQFVGTGHSGMLQGIITPDRVNLGHIICEMIDPCKIKFTDNVCMISDFYTAPEPVLGLFSSKNSLNTRILAVTTTSILLFTVPTISQSLALRSNETSATLRTQWISEPIRTQSFSETVRQGTTPTATETQQTGHVVGGVTFNSFNFADPKTVDSQDQVQYNKAAVFIRHSVIFAQISQNYLLIQDISGECHCLNCANLSLNYTIYNGICTPEQLALTDDFTVFIENSSIRVTETKSGNYYVKQLLHQRKIHQVAISSKIVKQVSGGVNFSINPLAAMTGQNASETTVQITSENLPIIAFIDSNQTVFTHQIQNNNYYIKYTTTQQLFTQIPLPSKCFSLLFPVDSNLLVLLVQDNQAIPQAQNYISGNDNTDFTTKLRICVISDFNFDFSLPLPFNYGPIGINLQGFLRAAAGISYENEADSSSRMIQQAKLLARNCDFRLNYIQKTVNLKQNLTDFSMATNCIVNIFGALNVVLPVPEFPFLLERSQGDLKICLKLCRYLQLNQLWSQLILYSKQQQNVEILQQSLAAVGQVPKALFESTNTVKQLLEQNKSPQAVQICCDLWDFEQARKIVEKDRRCGPILVYLRRKLHEELGSIADEKVEPWSSLAREFGDRANEACMALVE